MLVKIHDEKFQKAIKEKKLLLIQYSCSDINKKPINITSFFGLDYFTDEEFGLENDHPEFNDKLKKYFKNHSDYYFAFWNYNIKYGYKNLNIFSDIEIKNLDKRTIDLDDVFECYATKNKQKYVRKVKPHFETRYYFALLNNLEIGDGWIWGGNEKDIKHSNVLLDSSRLKVKITGRLISLLQNKTLKVHSDEKIIKKSKKIVGFTGKLIYWKKNLKKAGIVILIYILGLITNLIISLIANWISK